MAPARRRSPEELRRYDVFKLVVAIVLFVVWLFLTGRPAFLEPVVAPVPAPPGSVPTSFEPLRIESVDGVVRLGGSVPDAEVRDTLVAAARKALGRAGRVEDQLQITPGASAPGEGADIGQLALALANHKGVAATVDEEHVSLEGIVADEARRSALGDRVTAALGTPFTLVNQLVVGVVDDARAPATGSTTETAPADPGAAADGAAAVPAAGAPVSLFFAEGVTTVSPGDADRLGSLVQLARDQGATLTVSGFHSKTGSAARNASIARARAQAVRDLLVKLGVDSRRIVLEKPQETLGGGNDQRARRVDVSLGK